MNSFFQQLRKNLAARNDTSEELERIRVAYDQLIDVEKRKQYDEELGLSAKRKSRVDMRPLGFYAKSLSKAQQKWPTWERELLAALLSLVHFRSIVAGAIVEVHTDHLNNTVVNQALSNPDKILRMLLKIDSLVLPRSQRATSKRGSSSSVRILLPAMILRRGWNEFVLLTIS